MALDAASRRQMQQPHRALGRAEPFEHLPEVGRPLDDLGVGEGLSGGDDARPRGEGVPSLGAEADPRPFAVVVHAELRHALERPGRLQIRAQALCVVREGQPNGDVSQESIPAGGRTRTRDAGSGPYTPSAPLAGVDLDSPPSPIKCSSQEPPRHVPPPLKLRPRRAILARSRLLKPGDSVMTPGESPHVCEALRAREDGRPASILRHPAAMGRRWYSLDPPESSALRDSGSTAQGS